MKNRTRRSKSWLCFQPDYLSSDEQPPIDSDFKHQSSSSVVDPVYIMPNFPKISLPPDNKLKISSDKEIVARTRKRSSRRSLSRIVKAVFFQSSLRKSKKVQQDPFNNLKNLHDFKSMKKPLLMEELKPKPKLKDSPSSPLFFTPKSSSPRLTSFSEQKKKQTRTKSFNHSKTKTQSNHNRNQSSSMNGLCLLLITLMVMIFYGRICAIICTSTWIYFGPFRRKSDEEEEVIKVIKEEVEEEQPKKMESREYKKRVIMEGLLERNHSRF